MARSLFGTDGVRGRANSAPMTAEIAMRIGMAAGTVFNRGDHRHRAVVGKDTRLSGYMIEQAITAGFLSVGMDVLLLGPLPTPAVGFLTRSMRAGDCASHRRFDIATTAQKLQANGQPNDELCTIVRSPR